MQDIRNIKILIVGESNVGKTCIIERYIGREFDSCPEPTLGVSCFEKQVKLEENNKLTLNLWDTAGQERFQSLVRLYSKGALGCFIAYDITNRESFEKLENWFNIVLQNIKVPIILVGNKTDIVEEDEEKRKVSIEEGMDFAKKKNVPFFETSAKDKKNIDKIFKEMVNKIIEENQLLDKLKELKEKMGETSSVEYSEEKEEEKEKKEKKKGKTKRAETFEERDIGTIKFVKQQSQEIKMPNQEYYCYII